MSRPFEADYLRWNKWHFASLVEEVNECDELTFENRRFVVTLSDELEAELLEVARELGVSEAEVLARKLG